MDWNGEGAFDRFSYYTYDPFRTYRVNTEYRTPLVNS